MRLDELKMAVYFGFASATVVNIPQRQAQKPYGMALVKVVGV